LKNSLPAGGIWGKCMRKRKKGRKKKIKWKYKGKIIAK
jgi:hypothetical protein